LEAVGYRGFSGATVVARGTRVYDSAAALILMGDWCVLVYTTITQPLERNPGRVERQARDLATEMNRRASRAIDDLSLLTRRRLMGDPVAVDDPVAVEQVNT